MHASILPLVFALLELPDRANCQLPTPTNADRWKAIVEFKSSIDPGGVRVQVELNKPVDVLINWSGGQSSSSDNKNESYDLPAGKTHDVKVAVKFSQANGGSLNGGVIHPIDAAKSSEVGAPTTLNQLRPADRAEGSIHPRKNSSDVLVKESPLAHNDQNAEEGNVDAEPDVLPAVSTIAPATRREFPCGRVSANRSHPDLGGTWPWSVAVHLFWDNEASSDHCSGVLISDLHVVTASHCVVASKASRNLTAADFLVYLGAGRVQIAHVSQIHVHPDYNEMRRSDDIAVLTLARSVERSDYVRPICLPERDTLHGITGETATLVSWGQSAARQIVRTQTCVASDDYSGYSTNNTFCAGYKNGTFKCLGAVGSGLIFPKRGAASERLVTWQLHGIAIFLKPKAHCESVFVNVTRYTDWLRSVRLRRDPSTSPGFACGRVSANRPSPDLGGAWPWSAAIHFYFNEKLWHYCSGVLISDLHVVTAGHCVVAGKVPRNVSDFLVYLGTDQLDPPGAGIQIAQVSEIHVHPDYDDVWYSDDIAVMRLARRVQRGDYVRPICLRSKTDDLDDVVGETAPVASWGMNLTDWSVTRQVSHMQILSGKTCVASDNYYSPYITSATFCAGYKNETFNCVGAVGSGLAFPKNGAASERDVAWQLYGILLFAKPKALGSRYCQAEGYTIFVNVTRYDDWLRRVAGLT